MNSIEEGKTMETELTKNIKKAVIWFKPMLNSQMRTLRYAHEVLTPTGYVDAIRFEDYIKEMKRYCALLNPHKENGDERLISRYKKNLLTHCKEPLKENFPSQKCRMCWCNRIIQVLDMCITCYEVKITVADFHSKNGHNFHGNRNYYVVPDAIADKIIKELPAGIGLIKYYPESGSMRIAKECESREIEEEVKTFLLYGALKKWCDGKQHH